MPSSASSKITYVGHATVLIELDGLRALTDPVLRNRTAHLRRRGAALNAKWHEKIDLILISHMHLDHFDAPSLSLLDKSTPVVAPRGAGESLQRLGFDRIYEVSAGEHLSMSGVSLNVTRAVHTPMPRPNAPPIACLGYVLEGAQWVYFAGDTDLFDEMRDLRANLDVALLPVWGWGPRLGRGHLNPHRAAQATQLLNPRVAIPIHWGTLHPLGMGWMNPAYLTQPGKEFKRHAARLAPQVDVRVLQPGESAAF